MFKWFKKLKELVAYHRQLVKIVSSYEGDLDHLKRQLAWDRVRIKEAVDLIKERTDITADVHLTNRNPNQIIVTGRYRNADYVQVFTLADNELKTLVDQLREMQRFGVVSKIDASHSFRAVIEKNLGWK